MYENKVEIISTSKTVGNYLSKTIIELFQKSRFFYLLAPHITYNADRNHFIHFCGVLMY